MSNSAEALTGFGVRLQPSGAKTFVVNYRSGSGGRTAPNKRVTLGRFGRITPEQARRMAQELLGKVASGEGHAQERAESRDMPTLAQAFEDYLGANPRRKPGTVEMYRMNLTVCFGDWLSRSLDAIDRGDVEARFHRVTEDHGWATANQAVSTLRSIYRRSSIDHEGLRNPVELRIAGGGRLNRKRRRRISSPGRSTAPLARKGGCGRAPARAPRHLHHWSPYGNAPGRGGLAPLEAHRSGPWHPAGRGDQDRRAPGTAAAPPTRRRAEAAGRDEG